MSIWGKIELLAKELLGNTAPKAISFPRIEPRLGPEGNQPEPRKFTSHPAPMGAIEVLPEYQFIYQALQQGCPSIFVTGKAGTGKSTLIRWLCQQLSGCVVVAPTAIAAINVHGDTIHSFFGLPPRHIDPDEEFHPRQSTRLVLENIKYLIVDEVSMVLPNIVDAMSNILKSARRSEQPFGGVPTIFVGDLLQLPPVVSSPEEIIYYSERYETHHFFSADVFKTEQIIPVHLTRIKRQSDPEFIDALNQVRVNQNARDSVALFNRRCFRDRDRNGVSGIYLVPTNIAAKQINARELDRLPGKLRVYEATVTGEFPANRWKLNVPDRLELKVSAKVIFLRNRKPQWVNGDVGEVVELHDDHLRVKKSGSENALTVGKETWSKFKYTYDYKTRKIEQKEVGTFEQFPVALGWAITIHKSQGLTFDELTLDLGNGAFCEGQTYVALSRARSIDGITLSRPISMNDIRVDQAVVEFYRQIGIEQ